MIGAAPGVRKFASRCEALYAAPPPFLDFPYKITVYRAIHRL